MQLPGYPPAAQLLGNGPIMERKGMEFCRSEELPPYTYKKPGRVISSVPPRITIRPPMLRDR
jgi:hypothetical protein